MGKFRAAKRREEGTRGAGFVKLPNDEGKEKKRPYKREL